MNWADEVEKGDSDITLPNGSEEFDKEKGLKTVIEYKYNDDDKLVKVEKVYKIENRKVSKSIAKRKTWKKYGAAARDPPGPNTQNTFISEEIFIQFVHNKDDMEAEDDQLLKLKTQPKNVSCRVCKGSHWTSKCPYKDQLMPLQEKLQEDSKKEETVTPATGSKPAKYVPPNQREGGSRLQGESMSNRRTDETATIRVTNLSEETRESDLQELFKGFGPIQRIFLAKDKSTGMSKGFAFINFYKKEDAARAISGVSGFGYDHLILVVEWARPSSSSN